MNKSMHTLAASTIITAFSLVSGATAQDAIPSNSQSLANGTAVILSGYLDEAAFSKAAIALHQLRAQDPLATLRLEIGDTRGGRLDAGFAFATTLSEVAPIDLVCEGNLQSMAANLFVSWQGGARIAGENCTNFMLHDIIHTVETQTIGSASFVRQYVTDLMDNLETPYAMMTQATANASGLSLDSAKALYGFDCHLTPETAFSLNLVDHFEGREAPDIKPLNNPSPEEIHALCDTVPMKGYFDMTDWSLYNFNGVTALDIREP